MKNLVLYHAKCPDGFASAWAAWKKLGQTAEYIPCQYGDPVPEVSGKDVYIVDYSFPRAVLLEMAEEARHVTLLDHHKTAEADLKDLIHSNLEIRFDMRKSGATLTWNYFHGDEPCWLVDYAEDRDLWLHKLPDTLEINSYLQSLPHDFNKFSEAFEGGAEKAKLLGEGCLSWVKFYVGMMKQNVRYGTFLGYHNVPIVNAPRASISEVVGELSEGFDFAVGWHLRGDGLIEYSMRSRNDSDVSELAKSMGGGGHKNAAGFSSPKFPHEL